MVNDSTLAGRVKMSSRLAGECRRPAGRRSPERTCRGRSRRTCARRSSRRSAASHPRFSTRIRARKSSSISSCNSARSRACRAPLGGGWLWPRSSCHQSRCEQQADDETPPIRQLPLAQPTTRTTPPPMTVRHAKELPPRGGDTQIANMAMAYAALRETMKREITRIRVVHGWSVSRRRAGAPPPSEIGTTERPPGRPPARADPPRDWDEDALHRQSRLTHPRDAARRGRRPAPGAARPRNPAAV